MKGRVWKPPSVRHLDSRRARGQVNLLPIAEIEISKQSESKNTTQMEGFLSSGCSCFEAFRWNWHAVFQKLRKLPSKLLQALVEAAAASASLRRFMLHAFCC